MAWNDAGMSSHPVNAAALCSSSAAGNMDAGAVSIHLLGKGPRGAKPMAEVMAEILRAIRERPP